VEAFNGTAPVIQHTYTGDGGIKTVKIQGKFPRIYFVNTGDKLKLLSVEQWGDIAWTSMNGEFYGAENLQVFATDVPNLTNVKDMTNMFRGATNFNGDLSNRDVSKVTNFATMFYGDTIFNSDLSNWITNSGTNMSNMFVNAKAFNSDLSDWNVENVTTMANMFQ
jgi:surface protein